jgi:hypothetical protein
MAIVDFFTREIIVRRERDIAGTEKRNLQATATVDGYYNDLDAYERNMLGIVSAQAWKFFFPVDQDIKEGDELEDEHGEKYRVIEVTKHDIGINEHLEVIATVYNA